MFHSPKEEAGPHFCEVVYLLLNGYLGKIVNETPFFEVQLKTEPRRVLLPSLESRPMEVQAGLKALLRRARLAKPRTRINAHYWYLE